MTILFVGDPGDLTSVYLAWHADQRGLDVVHLDEEQLGLGWRFELRDHGDHVEGFVQHGDRRIPLREIRGAWVRYAPFPAAPPELALSPADAAELVGERRCGLHHWLDRAPFVVLNPSGAGRSNGSKPFQMARLSAQGFSVPEWIVTNDPQAALDARERWPGAIYKSASGLRSEVRRVDDALIERLRAGSSPVVIQRYIEGHEVRVHVVQSRVFPTAVHSDQVDWRFGGGTPRFEVADIPSWLGQACIHAAARERLGIAGLDFRVSSDGTWYCLEMNPMPTFMPYELQTGQPIAQVVLDVLVCARGSDRRREFTGRSAPSKQGP